MRILIIEDNPGILMSLTDEFDRSIDEVDWAGSSNRLYVTYDDHGKRYIGSLTMDGDIESIVDDVSSVSIGRPYTSGGFSAANNGAIAYSSGNAYRPADVAYVRRNVNAAILTDLNSDLLAHKKLAKVEEITSPLTNSYWQISNMPSARAI